MSFPLEAIYAPKSRASSVVSGTVCLVGSAFARPFKASRHTTRLPFRFGRKNSKAATKVMCCDFVRSISVLNSITRRSISSHENVDQSGSLCKYIVKLSRDFSYFFNVSLPTLCFKSGCSRFTQLHNEARENFIGYVIDHLRVAWPTPSKAEKVSDVPQYTLQLSDVAPGSMQRLVICPLPSHMP